MELMSDILDKMGDNPELDALFEEIELPETIDKDNIKTMIGMLMLPDEQFKILSPLITEGFDKIVDDPTMVASTLTQLKKDGKDIDFVSEVKEMVLEFLEDVKEITPIKKDFIIHLFDSFENALYNASNKSIVNIPIQLDDGVKMPTYAHPTDAGMDVYALEDITIMPGETKLIPTGIRVAIPEGYEIQVRPKSGRCLKTKLRVANTPGTIDSGYRNEIGVIIDNIDPPIKRVIPNSDGSIDSMENFDFGSSYTIGKGEKFAQLVLCKICHANFTQVDDITAISGDRGGGFGSTTLF